jgi:polyisoprenyl-teichoic acid--peptidoglycan teichoic acid transferase
MFRRLFTTAIWCFIVGLSGNLQISEAAQTEIPERMPLADEGDYDIVNYLLLGSDTTNPVNAGRTDVMMIVSVNLTAGTVALLSIPRDLWVYIPDHEMQRMNTAYGFGEHDEDETQSGAALLAETIEYNLGLHIDHTARVDFNGFHEIIDNLGGVEISVDCTIEDWRLKAPDLDPTVEDNWEIFMLPIGVHQMDGDLALWYVRSRRTTSDLDRGRRQQDVMRGVWQRIRDLGLLEQLRDVWPQVLEVVQTDVDVSEMLSLAPMATSIDTSRIASYTFMLNREIYAWQSPEGAALLVPIREGIQELVRRMMLPPTESQIAREQAVIEIVNASGYPGLDQVAADRLAIEGFVPRISDTTEPHRQDTWIYDYTGQSKGSSLATLQSILRVTDPGVVVEPDPNRTVDFRVVIGSSYYACIHEVAAPLAPVEAERN